MNRIDRMENVSVLPYDQLKKNLRKRGKEIQAPYHLAPKTESHIEGMKMHSKMKQGDGEMSQKEIFLKTSYFEIINRFHRSCEI